MKVSLGLLGPGMGSTDNIFRLLNPITGHRGSI